MKRLVLSFMVILAVFSVYAAIISAVLYFAVNLNSYTTSRFIGLLFATICSVLMCTLTIAVTGWLVMYLNNIKNRDRILAERISEVHQ